MINKYLHTIIEKFVEELKKFDVVVEKDGYTNEYSISDREKRFNELKLEIEALFKGLDGDFLVIETEKYFYDDTTKIICPNYINVDFHNNGYLSNIKLEVFDLFNCEWINVTTNSKIIKCLNKDVPFIEVLKMVK